MVTNFLVLPNSLPDRPSLDLIEFTPLSIPHLFLRLFHYHLFSFTIIIFTKIYLSDSEDLCLCRFATCVQWDLSPLRAVAMITTNF
jgi:hypothetical protein